MLEGKFKCVWSGEENSFMKAGKVYEFINGRFRLEDGNLSLPYNSMEDFKKCRSVVLTPYEEEEVKTKKWKDLTQEERNKVCDTLLQVEFRQWENVISAKIIYQDESLRNKNNETYKILASNNGYKIYTDAYPKITDKEFFIIGESKFVMNLKQLKRLTNG